MWLNLASCSSSSCCSVDSKLADSQVATSSMADCVAFVAYYRRWSGILPYTHRRWCKRAIYVHARVHASSHATTELVPLTYDFSIYRRSFSSRYFYVCMYYTLLLLHCMCPCLCVCILYVSTTYRYTYLCVWYLLYKCLYGRLASPIVLYVRQNDCRSDICRRIYYTYKSPSIGLL